MSIEKVAERIRKVWALAEHGEGGEKENAQRILDKLLKENNIALEDVIEQSEKYFRLILRGDFDFKLLAQTYMKVSGKHSMKYYRHGKSAYFLATQAHGLETLALFSIYKNALMESLDLTWKAFLYKNRIHSPLQDSGKEYTLTPEEEKELERILGMMKTMDHVKVHKMVEAGS